MRLDLLQLEGRCTPAGQLWYGGEFWAGTRAVTPFADWGGELVSLDAGHLRYVAPGPGGGPRVAVFDLDTGERDRPDTFAGDPASRAGVVFVGTDPPAPVFVPGVPHLTAGNPTGYRVYIDFEGHDGEDWVRTAFAEAARLLVPTGLFLTTMRPDTPAGDYGTVIVGAPLTFDGSTTVGLAPGERWDNPPADRFEPRAVYVAPHLPARLAGAVVAHEVGHSFGLTHRADPGNVMQPVAGLDPWWHPDDLTALRARVSLAGAVDAAKVAKWRAI